MKILISAAEASSDVHGAELLRAIKAQLPAGEKLEVFGIGGPKLQAEGLQTLVDARELLAMGTSEVLGRLPKILSALKTLSGAAAERKPDVAVVIDYPDFHFRLAKKLRGQGVPMVYYIPPKVWVWRRGRVKVLREMFSRVLCIFPFEEEFFRKTGVPVKYVGNPLLDELPLRMTREEARKRLGVGLEEKVLVVMPGSRPAEMKRHLAPMLEGAALASGRLKEVGELPIETPLRVLMPLPHTATLEAVQKVVDAWLDSNPGSRNGINVRVSLGDSSECMVAADAGLIKSGTSTLEAALLGCPHVVIYKPSPMTTWIFRNVVRYPGPVGLVNLVHGWKKGEPFLTPEILHEDVTAARLADESESLLLDPERRALLAQGFGRLREKLMGATQLGGPSAQAAREVLSVVGECRTR